MGIHICADGEISQADIDIVDRVVEERGYDPGKNPGESLCVKVRLSRAGRRMTLQELADVADIEREEVWAIESGKLTDINDQRVQKLLSVISK